MKTPGRTISPSPNIAKFLAKIPFSRKSIGKTTAEEMILLRKLQRDYYYCWTTVPPVLLFRKSYTSYLEMGKSTYYICIPFTCR